MSDAAITVWFTLWALAVLAFIVACAGILVDYTANIAWAGPTIFASGTAVLVCGAAAIVIVIRI